MKVFLTGATGLVGSFVLKQLAEKGYDITVLLRKNSVTNSAHVLLNNFKIAEGDILDELLLEKQLEGIDVVIHCAGLVSFNPSRNRELEQVNVQGTTNVVNACLKSKVKKLVHVSSIAAIGRNETAFHYNENSKWEDSSVNSFYAKSKYLAELEVFRGGEEGLDFSVVNPSVVLGPGDSSRSSTRLFSFIKKNHYAYPGGCLNVVDVRDVARVICELVTVSHRDRLVLNAGHIEYKELFRIVCKSYGLKPPAVQIPQWLIRTGAYADKVIRLFKGGEPFITKENLRFLGKHFTYSSLYLARISSQPLIPPSKSIEETAAQLKQRDQTL